MYKHILIAIYGSDFLTFLRRITSSALRQVASFSTFVGSTSFD